MDAEYIVRTQSGDKPAASEAQILEWLYRGTCNPGDFAYARHQSRWIPIIELSSLAPLFVTRPETKPEKLVIYIFMPGRRPYQIGPFSVSEVRNRIACGQLSGSSWIFIEGDREWRQIKNVKALKEMIPLAPIEAPLLSSPASSSMQEEKPQGSVDLLLQNAESASIGHGMVLEEEASLPANKLGPAASPLPNFNPSKENERSISIDLGLGQPLTSDAPPPFEARSSNEHGNQIDTGVSYEETTKAISSLGLSLKDHDDPPPPPGPSPTTPPDFSAAPALDLGAPKGPPPHLPPKQSSVAMPAVPADVGLAAETVSVEGGEPFDGVTAEIPTDPIWVIKAGASENAMGPFRFLEVIKFLEEGKINKNDKISRAGTNRFCKIQQQYEFNVKYTIENVVEGGVEKQKIFIRRRHPRVPYMADVQIQRHGQVLQGTCVNISAGGILVEAPKATFALGETLSVRILPGLIHQPISCDALVIGKVPKIPPGYALKFKELKPADKEAIDFFVQEMLKKEQQRAI